MVSTSDILFSLDYVLILSWLDQRLKKAVVFVQCITNSNVSIFIYERLRDAEFDGCGLSVPKILALKKVRSGAALAAAR